MEFKRKYREDIVLRVVKPLCSLAKAGNHWFATCLDSYKKKLRIEMTFYDTCLFITKDSGNNIGIVGLQTDDTVNVGTETFIKKEEKEIIRAKFKAKDQIIPEIGISPDFNGCSMTIEVESIINLQKNQAER